MHCMGLFVNFFYESIDITMVCDMNRDTFFAMHIMITECIS